MIKLAKSEALKRKIRQDDPPDLATSTWTLVDEALQAARIDQARELIEYGCAESKAMHDALVSFVDDGCTYIAGLGEEEVNEP